MMHGQKNIKLMNIYSAFVKYLKNGDKRRFLSPCSSHHLSESEPQFHCPTLESVHVSTVAGSILTCYKCFNDAQSYCTSAQWFQETRVTTGCVKMCVIPSAYAASFRVAGFVCFLVLFYACVPQYSCTPTLILVASWWIYLKLVWSSWR